MSYWEIWDSFTKVKHNRVQTHSFLITFSDFLIQKSSIEKSYASGLQRLSKSPLFTKIKNSLDPSLKRLQTFLSQQSENLSALIDHQQNDLIPILKTLLASQDLKFKPKARIGCEFESELQKISKRVEKSKEVYYEYCDLCQSPGENEEMTEKKYLETVKEANKFLKDYEENMKPIFELCQEQTEEKIRIFKETLRKFVVFEMAYVRSVQYELELLPAAIDLIDIQSETKKFIYDSVSEKPFKEFVVEIHPKCVITELDEMSEDVEKSSETILTKCLTGLKLAEEEAQKFVELLFDPVARKNFILKKSEKKPEESKKSTLF